MEDYTLFVGYYELNLFSFLKLYFSFFYEIYCDIRIDTYSPFF
jgi:hypothetical protein